MDTNTTIVIVAVVLAVAAVAAALIIRARRSQHLRSHFGPEYDQTLETAGDRRRAEHMLHEREKRVAKLELRPLSAADRSRYVASWSAIQAAFVDDPRAAVGQADELLGEVMEARGYPVSDFDQRAADLSVDHPEVVQNYRAGHDITLRHQRGDAGTEDLRQAMIHYRALFEELVDETRPDDAAMRAGAAAAARTNGRATHH